MKIKKIKLTYDSLAVLLIMFYSFNYTIAGLIYGSKLVIDISFAIVVVLLVISTIKKNGMLMDSKLWLLFVCILFALINNRRFAVGEYAPKLLCWFAAMICLILLRNKISWLSVYTKALYIFSVFHLICAWLFKIVPGLTRRFANLFSGATKETILLHYNRGFLTGITTHYSTLAIYLGHGVLVLWVLYFNSYSKKAQKRYLELLIATGLTLFMVGKRGMIVFVVLTLLIYSLVIKARDIRKILPIVLKYVFLGGIVLSVIFILANTLMPQMLVTIGRFIGGTEGTDFTGNRLNMWSLAINLFKEHPILGIGWNGYREAYESAWYHGSLDQTLDTHNVYLQLLCETGIVGFVVFMTLFISSLVSICKTLRKCIFNKIYPKGDWHLTILEISCVLQIIFLLYCFTGNPLYDPQNLIVYFLSIAAADTLRRDMRMKERI